MFDRDKWNEIFTSMRMNGLRTLLSGFTVTLGLFIFITLFGMGKGLENAFNRRFIKGSSNSIFIYPQTTSIAYKGLQAGRQIQFKNEDVEYIRKNYGPQLQYITAALYDNVKASYKAETGAYTIRACDPERQIIELNKLIKGRFLSKLDIKNKLKVAVIGKLVEKDLFKNENAIGKYINLNGINFQIVGTFSDEGGDNEERIIYTPLSTQQQLKSSSINVDEIILGYDPDLGSEVAINVGKDIDKDLRKKFQIDPKDPNGIYVRNMAEQTKESFGILFALIFIVGLIGAGTLIAGMMGIFNIMVYSVKERTKELGIRKALGAPPGSIIFLVLTESILVTLFAGIVGILLGIGFLRLLGNSLEEYFIINPSVSTPLIIVALLCLVSAGFIAGLIPSYRASKIKPIIALKDE